MKPKSEVLEKHTERAGQRKRRMRVKLKDIFRYLEVLVMEEMNDAERIKAEAPDAIGVGYGILEP
jgi:hypothetical protein